MISPGREFCAPSGCLHRINIAVIADLIFLLL